MGAAVHLAMPFEPYFYVKGEKNGEFASALESELTRRGVHRTELLTTRCCAEKRINFLGFSDSRIAVTRLVFRSKKAFTCARDILSDSKEILFESNVDLELQFLNTHALPSVGWVAVDEVAVRSSRDCIYVQCSAAKVRPIESKGIAPFVIASYDIEALSKEHVFPDAKNAGDVVFMIATSFQRVGESTPFHQHLVVLDECAPLSTSGVHLDVASSEADLIEKWAEEVKAQSTDILLAYNNYGFDDQYLDTRYRSGASGWRSGVPLSRMPSTRDSMTGEDTPAKAWIKGQRSAFAGFADSKFLVTPGIWNLDLLVVMKSQHQLESHKLDFVAEHFLQDHKIDLAAKDMFVMYEKGRRGQDMDLIRQIGEYCVKDTELPLRLINKLSVIVSMMEMAAATGVPIDFLLQRGQAVRSSTRAFQLIK